jgi:ABC-2 type transport system ATP-binding protein
MVGLLGPNGAGKTTLLKILSTLIEVDQGQVRVLGHDATRNPQVVRGLIGLVTCDERSFYWRLTGRQNLDFFATLYGLPARKARTRIPLLFEKLGLTEAADRPYHGYSTGMRQKMAIARGLLSEPRLVLYDEPTRSLDPLSAQNVRAWIAQNRREFPEVTHIIATNQLHEAEALCDRVIIVNRGEIITQGSVASIRSAYEAAENSVHRIEFRGAPVPELSETAVRFGVLDIEQREGTEPGTILIEIRAMRDGQGLSYALDTILKSGGVVLSCETHKIPFDEVFISLVESRRERKEERMRI